MATGRYCRAARAAHDPNSSSFTSNQTSARRRNDIEARRPDRGFSVPAKPWFRRSLYQKIRDRESYEFALASAACRARYGRRKGPRSRIALGGVATKPWRAAGGGGGACRSNVERKNRPRKQRPPRSLSRSHMAITITSRSSAAARWCARFLQTAALDVLNDGHRHRNLTPRRPYQGHRHGALRLRRDARQSGPMPYLSRVRSPRAASQEIDAHETRAIPGVLGYLHLSEHRQIDPGETFDKAGYMGTSIAPLASGEILHDGQIVALCRRQYVRKPQAKARIG